MRSDMWTHDVVQNPFLRLLIQVFQLEFVFRPFKNARFEIIEKKKSSSIQFSGGMMLPPTQSYYPIWGLVTETLDGMTTIWVSKDFFDQTREGDRLPVKYRASRIDPRHIQGFIIDP